MWYESQGPTELGVMPQGNESIVIDDLCFTAGTALGFRGHLVPAELLRASAAVAVESMDNGGEDEESVAEELSKIRPELTAEYGEFLSRF
jgi:hypothetical protein